MSVLDFLDRGTSVFLAIQLLFKTTIFGLEQVMSRQRSFHLLKKVRKIILCKKRQIVSFLYRTLKSNLGDRCL